MENMEASRDLLVVAMTMEDESRRFYLELAEKTRNLRVREFSLALANDEVRHCKTFYQMHLEFAATYQSAPLSESDFEKYMQEVRRIANGEKDVVAKVDAMGDHGALIYAIEREKQTVEFYEGLLKPFPQHAAAINAIIREEDGHVERLENLAAEVSKLTPLG